MRFCTFLASLVIAGCVGSKPASVPVFEDRSLNELITATVRGHALSEVAGYQSDTTSWYWSFDPEGWPGSEGREVEARIRRSLPAGSTDTLSAHRRFALLVEAPRFKGDTAYSGLCTKTSWEAKPCYWLHNGATYEFRFVRDGKGWKVVSDKIDMIADPAPLPTEAGVSKCRDRNGVASDK